jgi:hypothetical protein
MNEFADGYLLILMYIIELNTPKSQQYTAYIYAPDRMLTYTYTHRIIAAPLNSSQQPATKNFEEKMKMQNTQCVMYNNNNNTHIEHAQKTWGWEPTLVSVFFVLCFFLVLVLVVLFELLLFKCSNSLPLSIIGVWVISKWIHFTKLIFLFIKIKTLGPLSTSTFLRFCDATENRTCSFCESTEDPEHKLQSCSRCM